MKSIIVFILVLVANFSLNAQVDANSYYSTGGVFISIDNKNPIGLVFSHDGLDFQIYSLSAHEVGVKVKNNTDSLVLFSFNDSYFVSGGETESVITDETLTIDVDKPIQDAKIAPNTSITKRLLSKDLTILGMPLFSKRWANTTFKKTGESTFQKLVVVVKKGEHLIEHSFDFKVQGSEEMKMLKKGAK